MRARALSLEAGERQLTGGQGAQRRRTYLHGGKVAHWLRGTGTGACLVVVVQVRGRRLFLVRGELRISEFVRMASGFNDIALTEWMKAARSQNETIELVIKRRASEFQKKNSHLEKSPNQKFVPSTGCGSLRFVGVAISLWKMRKQIRYEEWEDGSRAKNETHLLNSTRTVSSV